MYYRRKVLLSLLGLHKNQINKIDLQKLLFIFTRYSNSTNIYDFVPYRYGCFSFQANADLKTLIKYGTVSSNEKTWKLEDPDTDYLGQLKENDKKTLTQLMKHHGSKSTNELIHFTYTSFPYWATKSSIIDKHLSEMEIFKVNNFKTESVKKGLYTIGYEGVSLEKYLNKLIKHDIKLLLDVRKNAKSMKYGFSKNQLMNACQGIGIEYKHIPEVGIESSKRTVLDSQSDYDKLFIDYKANTLTNTVSFQKQILNDISDYKRVALTCFEKNICQCHRKPLADSIFNLSNDKLELMHI